MTIDGHPAPARPPRVEFGAIARFCASIAALLALPPMLFDASVTAQTSAEVQYFSPYYGRYVSRFSGGMLAVELSETPQDFTKRGCETGDTVCGHWEGTSTARVADLALDGVEIQQGCCDEFGLTSPHGFGMLLVCAGGAKCFSQEGHHTGYSTFGSGSGSAQQIVVSCNSRKECADFLDALLGRQKPAVAGRGDSGATSARNASQPTPSRTSVVSAALAPDAAAAAPDSGFRDALDSIAWRKGSGGSMDDLARKTRSPARSPAAPPPSLTFAAFAQSAGFDANDGYGYALGKNLNDTIGRANTSCAGFAKTFCDDEGYCVLRPGMWGAWASDRKYLGRKAFTCNQETEDEAVKRALAWCGLGCTILWKGSAQ